MSDRQWAAMWMGDESYFNSKSWEPLRKFCKNFPGWSMLCPPPGPFREAILYEAFVKEGDIVPPICTSPPPGSLLLLRRHPGGYDLQGIFDEDDKSYFKGNMDTDALEKLFIEEGNKISFVELVVPNNLCAGQPVSMANIKKCREIIDKHKQRMSFSLDIAHFRKCLDDQET